MSITGELQFKVESGKICVSDPCYDKGTRCAAWDLDAQRGLWNCEVIKEYFGTFGEKVKELICIVEDYDQKNTKWKKLEYDIGVDSGQCGIFDYDKYPDGSTGKYEDLNSFYGKCCKITLNDKEPYGVLDFGVVSSSGFGDGSYDLYVLYDDNEENLVGVRVVFIDDDDEDDDDYENLEDFEDCTEDDYDCCKECETHEDLKEEEDENED